MFDDFPNLAALTSIDHLDSWRDLGIYLSQPRSFPGRPLAMLSFLAQKASWPDHSFPFKLVNLIIHLINGLLVYRLTWQLCRSRDGLHPRTTLGSFSRADLAASLAMAAWLLNPIQISAILLVVQRMTLLMTTLVLLGLLAYAKALRDESARAWSRGAWMALGLGLCMGLAFLSKENGILLPLYALVLDVSILREQVSRLPRPLMWWRRLLIWPVVVFIFAYLVHYGWQQWGNTGIRDYSLGERLLTEPRIVFDYIGKIFLPRFGVYGLYHDGYPISHGLFTPWTTALAVCTVLACAAFGWCVRKRWPLLALGILWYLGGQVIESSTLMLELYFEHRNYAPTVGLFIAIAMGLASIREPARMKLAMVASMAWLAACAFALALSAKVYGSADRLAATWAHQQPNSMRAQNMLAGRLYAHARLADAMNVVVAAQKKHPDNFGIAENLVYLKCMQGSLRPDDMHQLVAQAHTDPFNRQGLNSTETLRQLADSGHCPALDHKNWKALMAALLGNPHFAGGVAQGYLHYQLHELAVSQGNLDMAIKQLDAAYANDPNANIPRLKAKYLASAGLYQEAIETLRNTNYAKLPLLRRLLVDDRAINQEDIAILKQEASKHSMLE